MKILRVLWLAAVVLSAPMRALSESELETLQKSNDALQRIVLDDGLVCLVKEDHSAPVVAVQIWVGTGAVHEEENLGAGLSHYMEHMIFKGTPSRGPTDISRQIDDAGGNINAYTANDRTVFYADLPARNWKVGVDVLADAVMNASLPEAEWAREKEVILREFAMGYDDPDRVINKLLWSTAYRVHPYKVPVIGYEEVFRTMTRDQLMAFKLRHYLPDNMMAVVVGDISAPEVESYLRNVFKDFTRKAHAPVILPAEPPQMAARSARATGHVNVSRLVWAYHTVNMSDPDAAALDMLANIVGAGRSSRLTRDLLEHRQLVSEIDAWSYTPKDPGLFGISAVFAPTNEASVMEAIAGQVREWREALFSAEEIEKAKKQMLAGSLGTLLTMSGQASSYASGEFYAGNPRYLETYLREIEAVTPESLRAIARRYLRDENLTTVILAPEDERSITNKAVAPAPTNSVAKVMLKNGAPLIVREDHRLPFVNVAIVFRGGLQVETTNDNGATSLMAELLTRGTKNRTADQMADEIEQRAASLEGFSGRNSFGLTARALAEDAEFILERAADALLNPTFPQEEVEKQRALQIADIRQQAEQPMFRAQENLNALLFPPGHPYRLNVLGNEDSVARLQRDDIAAQHDRLVKAGNMALSVFGDITVARAQELAEKYFAAIPSGSFAPPSAPSAAVELPQSFTAREPREQAIVLLGFPGISLDDPRVDALAILARSLSGLSSDLGIEMREKRGLVYYSGAMNIAGTLPGMFTLYAGTRADAVAEVEQLMREQVKRIAADGLRDEEWQRAREQLVTSSEMELQNNGGLAQSCALDELYGLGYQREFNVATRLNALTGKDIQRAAASIFKSGREAVSIVLPEEKKP